jgi:hypothetical protein
MGWSETRISLGRLKFVDEKMKPTDEEIRKLYGTTESFGITQLEFSWGKKLTGVLNKLLGNSTAK